MRGYALGCVLFACSFNSTPPEIQFGQVAALVACRQDVDCLDGNCHNGLCASTCEQQNSDCDTFSGFACFQPDSYAVRLLKTTGPPESLCLATCQNAEQCGQGFQCVLGACLPASVNQGLVEQQAEAEAASRTEALQHFENPQGSFQFAGRFASQVNECEPTFPCKPLEEVLQEDQCWYVEVGCGITHLSTDPYFPSQAYWYNGFGVEPVAVSRPTRNASDGIDVIAIEPVECTAIESSCSTCGDGRRNCTEGPSPWPAQSPAQVPEACSCELANSNLARVSLECFCQLHACPSLDELSAPEQADDRIVELSMRQHGPTDRVYATLGIYAVDTWIYDPETRQLVGATTERPGPVVMPCLTTRLLAGETN